MIERRGDALAAAGLADEAERLAPVEVERDAVDGMDDAVAGEELGPQVPTSSRWPDSAMGEGSSRAGQSEL